MTSSQKVERILKDYPETREDDTLLFCEVNNCMELYERLKHMINFETISRCRRKRVEKNGIETPNFRQVRQRQVRGWSKERGYVSVEEDF